MIDVPFNPRIHHRRSLRLQGRDYRRGTYFITVCTWERACLFGEVEAGRVRLSGAGMLVTDAWRSLRMQPHVALDDFVVMPNHLHALITLGERHPGNLPGEPSPRTLGQMIGAFKAVTTSRLLARGLVSAPVVWQRNYYERTVQLSADVTAVRRYIAANPANWPLDEENPATALQQQRLGPSG